MYHRFRNYLSVGILACLAGGADRLWGADTVLSSDVIDGRFGTTVVTAGDVNGDGFSDLAIGADGFDSPFVDAGAVLIYYGSAAGLGSSPDLALEGPQDSGRFGASLAPAGDVNGDGFDDLLVGSRFIDVGGVDDGAAYLYLGSASGLLTAPIWSVSGGQFNSGFAISLDGAGDVNGDGFADIVIGAANFDNELTDEGRAYLYLGSPTGPSQNPSWVTEGNAASAFFGRSVAGVGDIDADGFDDVCIGAPQSGVGGSVFLFRGSAAGLNVVADTTIVFAQGGAQFGRAVSGAGDVNGDGFADVLVGARRFDNGQSDEGGAFLHAGSSTGLSNTPFWTFEGGTSNVQAGTWVAGVGDVDGDGLADVAVGIPLATSTVPEGGRVVIFAGAIGGPSQILIDSRGTESNVGLGTVIEGGGDINGDGFGDVVIGVPQASGVAANAGQVMVYMGKSRLPATVAHSTSNGGQPNALWGGALSGGGDVNGDGLDDVLFGSRRIDGASTDTGRAALHLGFNNHTGSTADDRGIEEIAAWSVEGLQFNEALGITVAIAGDVNGDGFDDLLVGAANYDGDLTDEGRVQLFYGGDTSLTGIDTTPAWEVEGDQEFCFFGRYVAGAGDVNGDGYADILVGSPEYDAPEIDEGRAFLYLGGIQGPALIPDWTFESDQVAAAFGRPVAAAGDVNGDGFDDVLIAARRFDAGESNEGRAYLFLGSALGLSTAPAWTFDGDQNNALFGISLASAGDVDADGYDDVLVGASGFSAGEIEEGRVFLFRGSPLGLSLTPDWMIEGDQVNAHLGSSVAGVGDVNADGFGDVLVGADGFDRFDDSVVPQIDLPDAGRVALYLGGAAGLAVTPAWIVEGDQSGARLGFAVSAAGDVDGNGFADFLVSAEGEDAAFIDEGGIALFLSNSAGVSRAFEQRQSQGDRRIPRRGVSDAPDAFRIAGVPRSAAGRVPMRLQWQRVEEGSLPQGTDASTGGNVSAGLSAILTPASVPTAALPSASTVTIDDLDAGVGYRWRARWISNHPRFPRTPWFQAGAHATGSIDVRMQPELAGVDALTCVLSGSDTSASWELPFVYDAIDVFRDGTLLASVAGDSTSFIDSGLAVGSYDYSFVGRIGPDSSVARSCQVVLFPAAVIDATCVADAAGVTLLWNEPLLYDEVQIERDGEPLVTLPGGGAAYSDDALVPGLYSYTITGVVSGLAAPPAACSGVVPEPDRYIFEFDTPPFPYQPETGSGASEVTLQVREAATNVGFPHGLQGISMSWRWDARLEGVGFVPGGALLALNQGAGPDFLGSEVNADVATVACVTSFMDPTETLSAQQQLDVGHLTLQTMADLWVGDFLGTTLPIDWEDGVGSGLPVTNNVVVNAQAISAERQGGVIQMVPTLPPFQRGDCNVNGNTNLSDVIFLLNAFFIGGGVECLDACDVNDDGSINLADGINLAFYLFVSGPPPAAPFPECGIDGFTDTLGCDGVTACH